MAGQFIRTAPSMAEAVREALGIAAGLDNPLVYIGGSTFVVAEAILYSAE